MSFARKAVLAGLSVIISCSLTPFRLVCSGGLLAAIVMFGAIAVMGSGLPNTASVMAICTGGILVILFVAILLLGEHISRHIAELSGRKNYIIVAEYSSSSSTRDLSRRNIVAAPI